MRKLYHLLSCFIHQNNKNNYSHPQPQCKIIMNDLLNSMLSDVTGDKKNLEYDMSDNLEEAKLWAINQNQALANKK